MKNNKALFIGRFAPPHKGHIEAIMKLTENFEEVVIGLGSCYEAGSPRHPFLAIFREKMLISSLYNEGCDLSKIKIKHIPDFPLFESWIENISDLIRSEEITHFVSGNKEDILNVMEEKGIKLGIEFIDPEKNSTFPYHATDLRLAITDGNYEKFKEIAASGTISLMGNINGFTGIKEAIENEGTKFYNGRQTVDVVVTMSDKKQALNGNVYYDDYVLCGNRPESKKDFPNYLGLPGGAIYMYESPVDAALRVLKEKAGIESTMLDNKYEPAHIMLHTEKGNIITTLRFLELFSSKDLRLAGTRGGSSQCYHIALSGNPSEFGTINGSKYLNNLHFMRSEDAFKQGLAYEQTNMIKVACKRLGH